MRAAVDYIRSKTNREPRVAVVLGSGLGAFAEELSNPLDISYAGIPGWPVSKAIGHAGKLVFGKIDGLEMDGLEIAVMAGRSHLYEGYSPAEVTMGVRVLHGLGVRSIIFTNAAGGINLSYSAGALVLISDHINLQGSNPLIGPNDDSAGPRFPDMTDAYSAAYRAIAHQVAGELGIPMPEGVYAAVTGPSYETPAEIRYLRTIGADLVGMSTVPEVIVANHLGMQVLAISCVTNMAAGILPQKINHEEVLETGRRVRDTLVAFLKAVAPRL
jgi:purine-nucleoside phosphorylase